MYSIILFTLLLCCVHAQDQCNIPDLERLDCIPNYKGDAKSECDNRGCCWMVPKDSMGQPWCYFPKNYGYFTDTIKHEENKDTATLHKQEGFSYPYPDPVNNLYMETTYETNTRIHIKIIDAENDRYEVPIQLPTGEEERRDNITYKIEYKRSPFSFKISRQSNNISIFNTEIGGFTYSNQFIQLSTYLPSSILYGLGEHSGIPLQLDTHWNTITIFSHDANCPQGYQNLYGHQPFYMGIDSNGDSYGVLFYNSNAMDIILQPTPALSFRTIGGIIDLYIFMGPTPEDVVEQYTTLVGKPFLPPVWGLGFQLCRYNYGNLNHIQEVHERMEKYDIPYDVQWSDIDSLDKCYIFTYDKVKFEGLPLFIDKLHNEQRKYVVIIDPSFPENYFVGDSAKHYDVCMKTADGKENYLVQQWAGTELVSDYLHPNITYWLEDMLNIYRKDVPIDAVWIDMNELSFDPSIPCLNNTYNNPPYLPNVIGGKLTTFTACMDALLYPKQLHYNVHSVYSYIQSKVMLETMQKITGKRSFDISRGSFVGQGHFGGIWGGDNQSTWEQLKSSIWTVTMFNMYGIPFSGVDICGFQRDTNEELCTRWTQFGAFYPFSRNHNAGSIDQDPAAFSSEAAIIMRNALLMRYHLLPYLYTLMFKSHITGNTVARPLFFNYPHDSTTYSIDEQMMWSDAILINPVLQPNVTSIHSYFPAGKWYSIWNKETIIETEGEWRDDHVTINNIPVYVKGGNILVTQSPKTTVFETRKSNITIEVYLDKNMEAVGEYYIDDGDSIDPYEKQEYSHFLFEHKKQKFSITTDINNYKDIPVVNTVLFYGFNTKPSFVFVNQKQFKPDYINGTLIFDSLAATIFDGVTIQWRY
ncbi:hypothetical protein WA158_006040 [Blastocystis sp. Blastoise]